MGLLWPVAYFVAVFARDGMASGAMLPGLAWTPAAVAGLVGAAIWWRYEVAVRAMKRRGKVGPLRLADATARLGATLTTVLTLLGVLVLGWLDLVRSLVGDVVLVDEAIGLTPILFVSCARLLAEHPAQRLIHHAGVIGSLDRGEAVRSFPSRWRWMVHGLRPAVALTLAPLAAMYAWLEAASMAEGWGVDASALIWVELGSAVVFAALLPRIVLFFLGTRSLGAFGEEVMARCARFGGKVRRVRLWPTHGVHANAAVLGLIPGRRTLIVTDLLLDELDDARLDAVLAHEAGHVRWHHLGWMVVGAASIASCGALAGAWIGQAAVGAGDFSALVGAAFAAAVGFGPMSRRFEWQADAHAVRCLSRAREGSEVATTAAVGVVASALLAVCRINGVLPTRRSWRHGTTAERVERIRSLEGLPLDRFPVDRSARRVRVAVLGLVVVAGVLGVLNWRLPPRAPDSDLHSRVALSAQEQKLCAHIAERRGQLLDDLRLHVGLPTGKNNRAAIDETRERFMARMQALGAKPSLIPGDPKPAWLGGATGDAIPPTLVCDRLDACEGTRVLIAGHIDTVHPPEGEFRELSIRPDGKTATGPGCVDMKGGLVIAAAALESLEACGMEARWTFTFNADEETGTYHSERALRAEAARHDVGLAIEPALPDGSLAIERMGSGQFMLETRGRSAHVGRAFADGVSAVTALAHRLVAIGGMPDLERGRIINVGPLEGGTATNAVPDRARAWGNVRFPDQAGAEALGEMLDALATEPGAMPSCVVHRSFNRPAKPLIPATEALGLRARRVAEDLGQSLPFARTGGVCDGNILQDAGLPTIDTLGVRGGGLHTPDEWIELASLVERCQLLAILVHRLTITTA